MLKYVIIREPSGMELVAFCLPPLSHRQLADSLIRAVPGRIAVAGGFVDVVHTTCRAFGHSESLNLPARSEDSGLISAFLRATADTVRLRIEAGSESHLHAHRQQAVPQVSP